MTVNETENLVQVLNTAGDDHTGQQNRYRIFPSAQKPVLYFPDLEFFQYLKCLSTYINYICSQTQEPPTSPVIWKLINT